MTLAIYADANSLLEHYNYLVKNALDEPDVVKMLQITEYSDVSSIDSFSDHEPGYTLQAEVSSNRHKATLKTNFCSTQRGIIIT